MSAAQFRKRPVVIEAVRWTGDNPDELRAFAGERFETLDPETQGADAQVFDVLHSTWVLVFPGQWVLRGVKGEFYPCADDVFQATYEPV